MIKKIHYRRKAKPLIEDVVFTCECGSTEFHTFFRYHSAQRTRIRCKKCDNTYQCDKGLYTKIDLNIMFKGPRVTMKMSQKDWNNVVRESLKKGYRIEFQQDVPGISYIRGKDIPEEKVTILYNVPENYRKVMEEMIERHQK